ncbi:MAG: hypothetical protein OXC40_05755 [Proteobacteria bacterium]|nr:hypothetical protein [Pseudomonadota bacterium]
MSEFDLPHLKKEPEIEKILQETSDFLAKNPPNKADHSVAKGHSRQQNKKSSSHFSTMGPTAISKRSSRKLIKRKKNRSLHVATKVFWLSVILTLVTAVAWVIYHYLQGSP